MKFNFASFIILIFCSISSANAKAGGGGNNDGPVTPNEPIAPVDSKYLIPGFLNSTNNPKLW